jgi:hypothetical protein
VEDISSTINTELKQIDKQMSDLRDELTASSIDLGQLVDYKGYLKNRFREKSDHNLKLWYEMLQFVKGERISNIEATPTELNMLINGALANYPHYINASFITIQQNNFPLEGVFRLFLSVSGFDFVTPSFLLSCRSFKPSNSTGLETRSSIF